MKNKIIVILLVIFVHTGIVFAGGTSESNIVDNSIIIGTEGTYPPYSYHDDTGKLVGYDVEVITAIADYLEKDITFIEARWDALLAGLKSNRWDVVANQVWWNPSRAQEYLLSESYLVAGATVLVRKENSATSSSDLAGDRAAVSLTSAFRPIVETLTSNVEYQDDFILAVDLLKTGRVDFVVNDTQAIGSYLVQNPEDALKTLPLENSESFDVVFALERTNITLLNDINRALVALKANGTIDEINKKYFAGLK